ncbi:MAG: multidrug effflux MFS transporter [Beijerinckiaceae bacterium]
MTAALAMLTALGPISTDLYLPSLPSIARNLRVEISDVQLTLSFYLAGFAFGQIFYGPISDKYGRRPVILVALGLYAMASAACALATSIELLIIGRFVQAVGAAGPVVLARAIVRDLYSGPRAGQELARMGMIMGLAPAIAPVIGGLLEPLFGWRASFIALLLASVTLVGVVFFRLPETLKEPRNEPISALGIFRGFRQIAAVPAFRVFASMATLTYSGLFCFISGSSFVLQGRYALSPLAFGLSFGFAVLGFIAGSIFTQKVVMQRGMLFIMRMGVTCLAVGGLSMLALMLIGTGSSLEVTLPMALYAAGVGLVLPQANAGSMMPFPDRAGAASSLQGLLQMSLAALVGAGLGQLLERSMYAMPVFVAVAGVATTILYLVGKNVMEPKT